ncbi:DUF1700 domain-containing protein [Lachnospiraceae bacterium 45-P1]
MKKETFLKELEYLLQDIPDEDKEEALSYYRDYLEEAGSENEDKVMEEFGSPERVAAIIRADITGNLKDGGSFTEKGYEDERFKDPGYQVAKRLDLPDEKEVVHENRGIHAESQAADGDYTKVEEKPWTNRILKVVLWGILIIAACPFLLGAGGIAVGAVAGIASLLLGTAALLVVLTATAFIVGVVLTVLGGILLFTAPMDGLFLIGIAVMGIGMGILGSVLIYGIFGVLIPLCFKAVCGLFKSITAGRKGAKRA